MKPKHQRLIFVAFSVILLCAAVLFALQAFRENLVFFYSPTELKEKTIDPHALIRVGGLVEIGSIKHGDDGRVQFRLTDGNATVEIHYQGMLPTIFREGQGAVAEGHLTGDHLEATRVLTKHDEKYMPKDVVDALKKSGRWRGEAP